MSEVHRITLSEHETSREIVDRETARLAQGSALGLTPIEITKTKYRLKASSWVGVDRLGPIEIEVAPKLGAAKLLYLASRGGLRPRFGRRLQFARPTNDVLDLLRYAFAEALERVVTSNALLSAYKEVRELTAQVEGRLDYVSLHTERFGQFPPLPCDVDVHGVDIPHNRLLLLVTRELVRTAPRHPSTSRLVALRARLEAMGVGSVRGRPELPDLRDLPETQLGPLASDYRVAVELADSILANSSLRMGGDHPYLAFALNMNDVFQKFLFRSLRKRLKGRVISERKLPLLRGRPEPYYQPDITWLGDREPRLVIDAKWMDIHSRRKEHLEQLLIYCSLMGLSEGVLVYGRASGDCTHELNGFGIRVHVLQLDVTGTASEIDTRLNRLASQLSGIAAQGRQLGPTPSPKGLL